MDPMTMSKGPDLTPLADEKTSGAMMEDGVLFPKDPQAAGQNVDVGPLGVAGLPQPIPDGYTSLPAGEAREVSVRKEGIGIADSAPIRVNLVGKDYTANFYNEVLIQGPSKFVHDPLREHCGKIGFLCVVTDAELLVK